MNKFSKLLLTGVLSIATGYCASVKESDYSRSQCIVHKSDVVPKEDNPEPQEQLETKIESYEPSITDKELNDQFHMDSFAHLIFEEYSHLIKTPERRAYVENRMNRIMVYHDEYEEASERYGVDVALIMGLVNKESGGKHYTCKPKKSTSRTHSKRERNRCIITGAAGEKGLMQLMPFHFKNAAKKGKDLSTPRNNILWGVKAYSRGIKRAKKHLKTDDSFEVEALAGHIYNLGSGRMKKFISHTGPQYQDYVWKIRKTVGSRFGFYSVRLLAWKMLAQEYLDNQNKEYSIQQYWQDRHDSFQSWNDGALKNDGNSLSDIICENQDCPEALKRLKIRK